MAKINVQREAAVGAPAELTYRLLADASNHPHFLPDNFTGFEVVEGGVGAGTLVRYTFSAGKRTRVNTMRFTEPEPGRVLTETDEGSSLVTKFTVTPEGSTSRVRIETSWDGAGGVGGFFERTFAPKALGRIYDDELARLDAYARKQGGPEGSGA